MINTTLMLEKSLNTIKKLNLVPLKDYTTPMPSVGFIMKVAKKENIPFGNLKLFPNNVNEWQIYTNKK